VHIGFWWKTPERKRSLERPRRRWEDNIRMDLGEIGWVGMVEPSGSMKCWEILEYLRNWQLLKEDSALSS
jgi:hypothetical protein